MLRDYIGDYIKIDGRMIGYRVETASDYLELKGLSKEEILKFEEDHFEEYRLINTILAVKHSCWLLRRTSHSCGSLAEDMYQLKLELIGKLKDEYNYEFDDELVEENACTDCITSEESDHNAMIKFINEKK